MSQIDVNQQWRELQENYSAMADEEIEGIALEAYDLTDIARRALQAEISRRQLKISLQLQPATVSDELDSPEPEPEAETETEEDPAQLIDLQRVWSLDEAKSLKETLDWAGVPVFFGPERVENLARLHADFQQGVDVRIRDFDQQRATAALAQAAKDKPPESDAQEESQYSARCPRCHSTEIVFQSLELDPVTRSAFDSKFNWSCDACGYQWKDDGIESET